MDMLDLNLITPVREVSSKFKYLQWPGSFPWFSSLGLFLGLPSLGSTYMVSSLCFFVF